MEFSPPSTSTSATLSMSPINLSSSCTATSTVLKLQTNTGSTALPPYSKKKAVPRRTKSLESNSFDFGDSEEIAYAAQSTRYSTPISVHRGECLSQLHEFLWRVFVFVDIAVAVKLLCLLLSFDSFSNSNNNTNNDSSYYLQTKLFQFLFAFYLLAPYAVVSIMFFDYIERKYCSKYYDRSLTQFRIKYCCSAPFIALFVDVYLACTTLTSNFTNTRYFSYYWNVRAFASLVATAIPTILSLCVIYYVFYYSQTTTAMDAVTTVNELVILALLSFVSIVYQTLAIYLNKQSNNLSFGEHFYRFLLLRNTRLLPYRSSILKNNLEILRINEPLTNDEWRSLARILENNCSISNFNVSFQTIPHDLFALTFKSLFNNQLTELYLVDCNLFMPIDQYSKKKVRLSAILIDKNNIQAIEDKDVPRPTMTGFVQKMQEVSELQLVKSALLQLISEGNLRVLNLNGNCISSLLDDIIKAVICNPLMNQLYLGNNALYVFGLSTELLHMLFQNCSQLEILDFSHNNFDDDNIRVLIRCLSNISDEKDVATQEYYLQNLKYINLSSNAITKIRPIYHFSRLHGDIVVDLEDNDIDAMQFERFKSVVGIGALMNEMQAQA